MARDKFSPELRERAVRMVLDHLEKYNSQWQAINSIAEKIGCSRETLRQWVRQAERDQGATCKALVRECRVGRNGFAESGAVKSAR